MVVVADPLRAGNELVYYPGETVARMADVLIVNKVNSATKKQVARVRADLNRINQGAKLSLADSVISVDNPRLIKGKSVLLVEDGPTITHGNMLFGAATVAAKIYGARRIVDPRTHAVGSIKEVFNKYRHITNELPAMGYSPKQIKELEATINAVDCDVIISSTPTDLKRLVNVNKPIAQVSYELRPRDQVLDKAIKEFVAKCF
jgi:predicted GTPase